MSRLQLIPLVKVFIGGLFMGKVIGTKIKSTRDMTGGREIYGQKQQ